MSASMPKAFWAVGLDTQHVFFVTADNIGEAAAAAMRHADARTIAAVCYHGPYIPAVNMPPAEDTPGSGTLSDIPPPIDELSERARGAFDAAPGNGG